MASVLALSTHLCDFTDWGSLSLCSRWTPSRLTCADGAHLPEPWENGNLPSAMRLP